MTNVIEFKPRAYKPEDGDGISPRCMAWALSFIACELLVIAYVAARVWG